MAERHPREDEAARYILGELTPSEQREFEAELAQSVELRALVQELEEGVETLARAVPQRPPPPQTWAPIEQAIAAIEQEKVVPAFWVNWWRSGWAVAAACLLGWAGYALWMPRSKSETQIASPTAVPNPISPAPASTTTEGQPPSVGPDLISAALASSAAANANRELNGLRWQIATLQTQLQELTQTLSEQQTALTDPGRLKFFPTGSNSPGTTANTLSPGVQRALFYAMAQELGWMPNAASVETLNSLQNVFTTNLHGVDFVYLPVPANARLAQAVAATSGADAVNTAMGTTIQPSGEIPGFFPNNGKLVMAFDSTTVPRGRVLSFYYNSLGYEPILLGDTVATENPMIVSLPTASFGPGGEISVTASLGFMGTNTLGRFFLQTPSLGRP